MTLLMAGGIMAMMLVGDLCYGVCMATVPGVNEPHGYVYVYWVSSNPAVSCGGVFIELGDELCKYWNRQTEIKKEKPLPVPVVATA